MTETILTAGKTLTRADLLGEVVSWDFRHRAAPLQAVRDALDAAGIGRAFAPDMSHRKAITRTMKAMRRERVIRKLSEKGGEVKFQFTAVEKLPTEIRYDKEAVLTLDKVTGQVTCPERPDLATAVQGIMQTKASLRGATDLHKIVSAYFGKRGDLYPVRNAGGCYFVPHAHLACSDAVAAFVDAVGGSYRRFPVPARAGGDKSVKETMEDGLSSLLEEYRQAAASFDPTANTELSLTNAVKRLQKARLKIEGYRVLLADAADRLHGDADDVQKIIDQKLAEKHLHDAKADPA